MPTHIVQFAYLLETTISWKFLIIFSQFSLTFDFFLPFSFLFEVTYPLEVLNLKYVDWRFILMARYKTRIFAPKSFIRTFLTDKSFACIKAEYNEKASDEKQFHRKIFCFLPHPLFFLQGKTNKEAILWQLVICLNKSKLPTASFRITQKMFKPLIIS